LTPFWWGNDYVWGHSYQALRNKKNILVVPIMKKGPHIDHLLLLNVGVKRKIELSKKIRALGDKFTHIKNIVAGPIIQCFRVAIFYFIGDS